MGRDLICREQSNRASTYSTLQCTQAMPHRFVLWSRGKKETWVHDPCPTSKTLVRHGSSRRTGQPKAGHGADEHSPPPRLTNTRLLGETMVVLVSFSHLNVQRCANSPVVGLEEPDLDGDGTCGSEHDAGTSGTPKTTAHRPRRENAPSGPNLSFMSRPGTSQNLSPRTNHQRGPRITKGIVRIAPSTAIITISIA